MQQEGIISGSETWTSLDANSSGDFIFNFSASRTVSNEFLLLMLLSLSIFAIAAGMD
jgi:hypothetical protein